MGTITSNRSGISLQKEITNAVSSKDHFSWNQFWKNVEFNRYGIATYLLVALVCVSGWAAAVAVQDPGAVKLLLVAVAATMLEAFVLSIAPMRLIVLASLVLLTIDLIVIFS
jgi:hypothetical protein